MGDAFHKLPAPILLMILQFVPSLPSLRSLILASKAAADIFDECGAEILESVIGYFPEELQWAFRAAAMTLYDFDQHESKYTIYPFSEN